MPIVRKTPNQFSIIQKMLGYAAVYNSKLHVDRISYKNFRVLFVIRGSGKVSAHDQIAGIIDANNKHVLALIPPGFFLFADYDDLMRISPLVGGLGRRQGGKTVLAPRRP